MSVTPCESDSEVNAALRLAGTTPVIIDFFATWCGPCRTIAPFFKDLSVRYPQLKFIKANVDTCGDTKNKFGITAMPTFVVVLNGQKMDTVRGANKDELEKLVIKWSQNVPSQLDCPVPGQLELSFAYDRSGIECLNEDDHRPLRNLLEGAGPLASDCDEQLILNVPFNQPVKIHSIQVKGPGGRAPKNVKIFANVPTTLDFDKAQATEAIQTLDFGQDELHALKFVKFQNVSNIQLFVIDNKEGGELTIIDDLKFFGQTVANTNMQDFKRVAGKAGEVGH